MADRTTTITLSIRDAFSSSANAFVSAMTKAESMAHKLGQKIGTTSDLMRGLGINLPTNPMMALGEAIKFSVDAAIESQNVFAQTEAGVKSTGGAAGYTAKQLADLAHSFQDTTTYSDETILSAENLLITFDKIRGPILKDATQAVLDLSTRMGGDLQGAAIQVGKALQDPAVGLTALRRVGVSFNEEQIKVIKNLFDTGKEAEAQKLILAELAKEFGGSATAAAKTFGGQIKQTQNAIDDMGEDIGGFLIGVLGDLAKAFQEVKKQTSDHSTAVDDLKKRVQDGTLSFEDYNKAIDDMAEAQARGNLGLKIAIKTHDELSLSVYADWVQTKKLDEGMHDGGLSALDLTNALNTKLSPALEDVGLSASDAAKAAKGLSDAWKDQMDLQGQFFDEEVKFGDKQADLTKKAKDLRDEINKLKDANGDAITVNKDVSLSADEQAAAIAKLAKVNEDLTQAKKKSGETDIEFKSRMADLAVQADNLRGKIDGTSGAVTHYIDNSKKIKDLEGQWDGVNKDIKENQKAHDEATKHIIYDYAMQRLAVDGFTDFEIEALESLRKEYGFTSGSSEDMAIRVIKAANKLAEDKNIDTFTRSLQVVDGTLVSASGHAQNLQEKIAALHDKEITVTIHEQTIRTTEDRTPVLQGGTAVGADFDVPPGYPRDSYPMRVQSGEHVTVTPANQVSKDNGGGKTGSKVTINIHTSQPITPQNLALIRAQAGAF